MHPFTMSGLWWLSEAPEAKAYGTLSGDEAGQLHLKVVGGFPYAIRADRNDLTIYGEVSGDARGDRVTLTGCFKEGSTIASNPMAAEERYFAHRGFLGAHLLQSEDFAFHVAHLSFSGMARWAHTLTGFAKQPLASYTASWQQPEPIVGALPNGRFVLSVSCGMSRGVRNQEFHERVGLALTFENAMPEPHLYRHVVSPLQNFFTFATDHPNAVKRLAVLHQSDAGATITIVGPRTFTDDSTAEHLIPSQMLFSYPDVEGRLEDIWRRWFAMSEKHSRAFAIYFGAQYRPPGYTDLRFQLMMQVLALYYADRNLPLEGTQSSVRPLLTEALKHLPRDLQGQLVKVLDSHPVISAERALVTLATENRKEFEPLTGSSDAKGLRRFTTYALNTLSHILTRDPIDPLFASSGEDLYWLTECLALLFKTALLKDLGFPPDRVHEIVTRNDMYRHIRDAILPFSKWAQNSPLSGSAQS